VTVRTLAPCSEIVDLRDVRDEPLLDTFYHALYLPAFPMPSEREDPAVWRTYLWSPERDTLPSEMHCLLAGSGLLQPTDRVVCGGLIFVIFTHSKSSLVTYIVVDASRRRLGLGQRLFRAALEMLDRRAEGTGGPRGLVFAEVNNPIKIRPEQDVIDPWRRLAFFERLGGRIVDIPYVQPALGAGQERGRDLLLLAFPGPRQSLEWLPSSAVAAFLVEFYAALGVSPSDADLQRSLDALAQPRVELLRPEDLGSSSFDR
jgi:GNAT superfamily N-acetyltransferase